MKILQVGDRQGGRVMANRGSFKQSEKKSKEEHDVQICKPLKLAINLLYYRK